MPKTILIASPRGYCAGVDRAVKIVEAALEKHGAPVYVRHQIVHNDHVTSELEDQGAIFVEETKDIPEGSVAILSAHGVPPEVYREAVQRNLTLYDATCPLVKRVHDKAKKLHEEGYEIVMIGHKGHQEVIGTMGEVPSVMLVENLPDVADLTIQNPSKLAVITQTTLSLDDTKEIMDALQERFPEMTKAPRKDICYATQNRQNAMKELLNEVELIIVVGAEHSSNSNRLRDVGQRAGMPSYLIPDASELQQDWFEGIKTIGLSSGASVPDRLVEGVIEQIQAWYPGTNHREVMVIEEKAEFAMPEELINL